MAETTHDGRTFDPARTPGALGQPPAHAPRETVTGYGVSSEMVADQLAKAAANERELKPLVFTNSNRPIVQPAARPEGKSASGAAPARPAAPSPAPATIVAPGQSRLRQPGVPKPSVHIPADTRIILTDAHAVGSPAPAPAPMPAVANPVAQNQAPAETSPLRVERPPVSPEVGAHLASPLAEAARKLNAQRALTHQPAASDSDTPSRGIPQQSTDLGKQITGGFGDAGDAQYYPLDGSELRELVRGLMSVIDQQLENDLRFSMAITYPRVAARVVVEVQAYAAGGDGGQYDPGFVIEKVMPPHDKTPMEIAQSRAYECVFVVVADRREMTADGKSIAPPNAIREELGLTIPRKQAIQTPQGRLLVDLRA